MFPKGNHTVDTKPRKYTFFYLKEHLHLSFERKNTTAKNKITRNFSNCTNKHNEITVRAVRWWFFFFFSNFLSNKNTTLNKNARLRYAVEYYYTYVNFPTFLKNKQKPKTTRLEIFRIISHVDSTKLSPVTAHLPRFGRRRRGVGE